MSNRRRGFHLIVASLCLIAAGTLPAGYLLSEGFSPRLQRILGIQLIWTPLFVVISFLHFRSATQKDSEPESID